MDDMTNEAEYIIGKKQKIIDCIERNKDNLDNILFEIQKDIEDYNTEFVVWNNKIDSYAMSAHIKDDILNGDINNIYKTSDNFELFQKDNLIRNGLITIAGHSSSGKTSFATQLALDILDNNENTVFLMYSLDDSIPLISRKMIKQFLNYKGYNNLTDTHVASNNATKFYDKLKNEIENDILDDNRIYIFENINIHKETNIDMIEHQINQVKKHYSVVKNIQDVDDIKVVLIIDYLQVIEHDSSNIREGLNTVCKELKNLQKKYNCLLMALSQLSNEGNYRETSEIRNVSDVIINIHKESEYLDKRSRAADYDTDNNHLFEIVKNKIGLKGMVFKAFIDSNFSFSYFTNYDISGIGIYKKHALPSSNTKTDELVLNSNNKTTTPLKLK